VSFTVAGQRRILTGFPIEFEKHRKLLITHAKLIKNGIYSIPVNAWIFFI